MAAKSARPRLPPSLDSPWPERTTLAVVALLAIDIVLALWGWIQSWVFSYKPGAYGNNFTGVWINGFTFVLCTQSLTVLFVSRVVTAHPARFWAWLWYSSWLAVCGLICIIGIHLPSMASQYAWTFLWYPHLVLIAAVCVARRAKSSLSQIPTVVDVEASQPQQEGPDKPPACTKAAWRQCWLNYWSFVGWSSLFWLSFLGFFLALQAAFLVTDSYKYPPPGTLYRVPQDDGTGYVPNVHMLCKGPLNTGLSTFLLEAGGGAPGIGYACDFCSSGTAALHTSQAIADALAAAGRRACWYDRLGYGWSDDIWNQPADMQSTTTLFNLLKAAGEPGPFIIAGHSAGGQLNQIFAAVHPTMVTGLALLDSFDDIAIALGYMGSENATVTLKSGEKVVKPRFTYLTPERGALVDVLRAVTPFAWARFITTNTGDYTYLGALNAAYGNNKEWHVQWVQIAAANNGIEDMSDQLARLAGSRFWQGTGWPSHGSKPVVLMPAYETLAPMMPEGCTPYTLLSNTTCKEEVLADPVHRVYPHLYLSYLNTISSNMSLVVMPGKHDFPQVVPKLVADTLLAKFAGV